jgi:transglutaminase-like putative cysteine protease
MIPRKFLAFPLLFIFNAGFSQDWRQKFPEAEAVYSNVSCEVNIRNEKGKISALTKYSEDILLASEKGARMMGRGSIYHGSFDELKDWQAYTISPENKKMKASNIQVESSRQSYVFYDDSKTTSFDFSGIGPGVTRHIDYEIEKTDGHLLTPFYFDRYFPVLNGELKINFPSSVTLKYKILGAHANSIKFEESSRHGKTTYTFTLQNEQGLPDYPDAPDDSWYSTHVVFYIDKAEENGEWKNYLATVDELYKFNYGFLKGLNEEIGTELAQLTDSITAHASSDEQKTRLIYKWVQSHIKYVAFENGLEGFMPRQASLVCTRRFGDCKDMASILTAMLTHAGVKAYYTWIGTRSLPYKYSELPLPIVDNHMICTAFINGKYIFLDATDDDCIFGMPSRGIQGKEALLSLSKDEYKLVTVETVPKEKNTVTDSTFLEITPKGLTGHIKVNFTGYPSSYMHGVINYQNEKEREEYFRSRFSRGSNKIRYTNWKITQSENMDHTEITADLELPDYARKLGDEWLLNLNLFKFYEHEEIDFPKRKSPIGYSYLSTTKYTTVLKLPAGFKASNIPAGEEYKNEVWGFTMNYKTNKDAIILDQQFDTDYLMLQPDQFEKWNKVLEHLYPHYKQTIVLSQN